MKWLVLAAILVVGAIFGWRYWREAGLYVSTDDAYVQADQVEVTSQVAGQVTAVHVRDQQAVRAGEALFDIDARDLELAVENARATLAQRRAEATNAAHAWERNQQLMKSGFLSPQGGENARTQLATAQAAVQGAESAVHRAELDLERAKVVAPSEGIIANLTLRPGNRVQPGQPLFVIIGTKEYWVEANFKETELGDIHPGQKASIKSDVYPDHPFEGTVQSVSGGSGSAFSLLPPQNATGNWVKVTQRVPVRIRIEDPDPQHPLRIGTTAAVKVRKAD